MPPGRRSLQTVTDKGQIATEEQICDEKDDVGRRLHRAPWARTAEGLRERQAPRQ